MKLRIRDVLKDGIDYEATVRPSEIGISEEFIDLESPVFVKGRLERVNDFILAELAITYTSDTICARCLENIHGDVTIPGKFDMEFSPGDEYVDLGVWVKDEILMAYTPRTLCREDCKGICQGCGAYLNEENCECHNQPNGDKVPQ
jgi:uncharacterized protein